MRNIKTICLYILLFCTAVTASARDRQLFDDGWLFLLSDSAQMAQPDYGDAHWRSLKLPHDWAVEGNFSVDNPSGAGGGALPGGIGWYRKHFHISGNMESPSHRYYIQFDGVYMNSTVYVNGHQVGFRPYGYSTFEYDITPFIHIGADNVIAVRVDNSDQPNSRWYSGCGIYRHVWLTEKESPLRIAHWGTFVTTDVKGKVHIETRLSAPSDVTMPQFSQLKIHASIYDGGNNLVAETSSRIMKSALLTLSKPLKVNATVHRPHLWSVEHPYLYKVKVELIVDGQVIDTETTTTGFRHFRFDANTGFWLNGKNMKINGVCMHHDLGCLGAALYEDALHRQLLRLKEMGANAIRCSHNPPSPELLNMCDSMGFIVMDESFDMWRRRKTKNDYARFFDQWHERDLTDLVLRDRNHPSVMMWSIGNEVLEQWSSADADTLSLAQANLILNAGHDASQLANDTVMSVNSLLTRHLCEIVRRYDTTRPITAGCNETSPDNHLFKSGALDIIGFNYHRHDIKNVPKNFPGKPFLMSESVSALQTRGYYMMPSDSVYQAPKEWWLSYTDPSYKCSAYDNMHASWSSTHEQTWDIVKHTPYCSGQFIWTGFDYLGEPTPYGYPARSSYFGIIDLAGFPKDIYYMYQSEWTTKTVLHLFPHWNWLPGQNIDMWCYYNHADEVELFINGKSMGVRRKSVAPSTPYHALWHVVYEPGELKVVSRLHGMKIAEQTIHTAGTPDRLRLCCDYAGKELTFYRIEVVDKDGNICPRAALPIFLKTTGTLQTLGVDNGLQTSTERFQADRITTFNGKALVVVRGKGTLTVQTYDMPAVDIE